jgi:hypothetical protein
LERNRDGYAAKREGREGEGSLISITGTKRYAGFILGDKSLGDEGINMFITKAKSL